MGVDLATGSGALAMVMQAARPGARVVGTEIDPVAVRCARRNGVTVHRGHLDRPLPAALASAVDVLCGVLPYVPSDALHLLPRDVLAFSRVWHSTAGSRVSTRWPWWPGTAGVACRPGGWLALEVGGGQVPTVSDLFEEAGYGAVDVLEDEDGDPRAVVGRRSGRRPGDRGPTAPVTSGTATVHGLRGSRGSAHVDLDVPM